MSSPKVLWSIILLLLIFIAGIAFKMLVVGHTSAGNINDERTQIHLTISERTAVLSEMRQLLFATQNIIAALATRDMQHVAKEASLVGMQATSTMDMRLMAKLPLEFKKMGMSTHKAFDEIAIMARQNIAADKIQLKLVDTMNNCISCHATFQFPSHFTPQ